MRIKDNSKKKKEDFHAIPGLIKRISNKTLTQLEKDGVFVFPKLVHEAEDLSGDQMILQAVDDCFVTSNIMGYLGCGDERLVISSRFSADDNDFFFQYLLEKVLEFPNVINLESNANKADRMFNLLLFLFPQYLKAAMRKGIYKTYIRNEYNDENVHGTIDIQRQIKTNIPFTGKIAYNQREHAYDNYMMELIRHTIEFIKSKPYGHKLLESVKDEISEVKDVTVRYSIKERKKIIEDNKKNTVRHAYYHEYRALQRLCILILQNENHQIGFGNRKVYGILFDGAWLWEEYVNILVKEAFYHPKNKAGSGIQSLFTKDGYKVGTIFPDFIGKNKDERVIADAKYKPIDNIGNKDYLQVLAYMFRFDSKKGYYFYPEAGSETKQTFWLNEGVSYDKNVKAREDISLIKYGLLIPSEVSDYTVFVMKMKNSEKTFKNGLGIIEQTDENNEDHYMQTIKLIHGSCADQKADVVVNAANKFLMQGGGICGVIFGKAGSNELATACAKHKSPLKDGEAVLTPAFGLKNAKAIIHAVGPDFGITPTAFKELYEAYYNSLVVMMNNGYHSISFPLISSGIFGGDLPDPVGESTKQCIRAYKKFNSDYPNYDYNLMLCAFASSEYVVAKKTFDKEIS